MVTPFKGGSHSTFILHPERYVGEGYQDPIISFHVGSMISFPLALLTTRKTNNDDVTPTPTTEDVLLIPRYEVVPPRWNDAYPNLLYISYHRKNPHALRFDKVIY